MGERPSGDGVPGRRRVPPGGIAADPWDVRGTAALETALAAALQEGDLDPGAEQRAVAAFRSAYGAGARRARARRRDDWRRPAERRAWRRAKTMFTAVFASLALGGVAVAAIGSSGSSTNGAGAGRGATHSSALAPERTGASPVSSGGLERTERPATAKDAEAHCRAYEQVKVHGQALDATAWQWLVAAAGGEDKVAEYCSEQLAGASAAPSGPGNTSKPGESAAGSGKGTVGNTGTSGDDPGATGDAGENDKASGRRR